LITLKDFIAKIINLLLSFFYAFHGSVYHAAPTCDKTQSTTQNSLKFITLALRMHLPSLS